MSLSILFGLLGQKTPVAKFKLSASTLNSAEVFEKARTGAIVIVVDSKP